MIVLETSQAPGQVAATARRYGISRSLLLRWRRSFQPEPKDAAQTYLRERCITFFTRNRKSPLPSPLLLPPRRAFADRDLAGDDSRGHGSFRRHHRRASHLACAGRLRQTPSPCHSLRSNVKIFARTAGTLVGACRSGGLFVMREQTLATPSIPRAVHAGIHVAALSFRLQEPSSRFLPLAQKSASVQDNDSGSAGEEPHRDSHS